MTRVPLQVSLLLAVSCSASAFAQTYPGKPITIIVPFSVGTPQDLLSRSAGKAMGEHMATSVIVDNRPGASGSIGNSMGGKAAPDGYTLLMTSTSFIINKAVSPTLPYEPLKYTPIALLATGDMGLVVSSETPVHGVPDFVSLAKSSPGKLTYASPGNGTPQHLGMELFKLESGIDVLHIPYRDNAGAVTAIVAGQSNAMMSPVFGQMLSQIRAGKVKLIAVLTSDRVPTMPAVPTFKEAGFPNVGVHVWYGLLGPAGLPTAIVSRLSSEINMALKQPGVRDVFEKQGLNMVGGSAERFAEWMRSEALRWARVVKEAGIKAD